MREEIIVTVVGGISSLIGAVIGSLLTHYLTIRREKMRENMSLRQQTRADLLYGVREFNLRNQSSREMFVLVSKDSLVVRLASLFLLLLFFTLVIIIILAYSYVPMRTYVWSILSSVPLWLLSLVGLLFGWLCYWFYSYIRKRR
jgi:hypothetical protein